MGDLQEELRKAGLTTERPTPGGRGHAAMKQRRHRAGDRSDREAGGSDARRPLLEDPPADDTPEGIVRRGKVAISRGSKRFYFVDRQGQIPFLELGDETIRDLIAGALAIVESPGTSVDEFVVVTAEAAEAVQAIDAEMVRFWNERREGSGGRK